MAKNAPAVLGEMKPRLYLSLKPEDLDLLKECKIGEKVRLSTTGKVVGLEQREHEYDGKKEKCGSLDLENYTIEAGGDLSDLLDDD